MKKLKKNPFVKPFLKWAGGKRQLLAELRSNLPPSYRNYVEPFVGAGALLFDLQPQKALINDLNQELIRSYKTIQAESKALVESLKEHKNTSEYFYAIRHKDREPLFDQRSDLEKVSRLIYLNKTCYNGLFRVNSQGQFNAPYGRYKNPAIVNEPVIKAVSEYLNSADIAFYSTDFSSLLNKIQPGDFVYLDPPYDILSDSSSFTGYTLNGFSRKDQERLFDFCAELDKRGVYFMQSNASTAFIQELYQPFHQKKVKAKRSINSNASKRGAIDELIIKNY